MSMTRNLLEKIMVTFVGCFDKQSKIKSILVEQQKPVMEYQKLNENVDR